MPPEGYTTVTLSDDVLQKVARLMATVDSESYAEAIEWAVDYTLARDDQLTEKELVEMLNKRI